MFPNEFKKLILRMSELNLQRLRGGTSAGFGAQGKYRGHPLASVGLPPDAKEPVGQIAWGGVPKDPVGKPLGSGLPDQLRSSAPRLLGSGAISLRKLSNSILNSGPEGAPEIVEI